MPSSMRRPTARRQRTLRLPEDPRRRLAYVAWYDTGNDWGYPPDPSPRGQAEWQRLNPEARELLAMLGEQLGPAFEIEDQSGTAEWQGSASDVRQNWQSAVLMR